jgi:IS5 family transposase
MIKVSVIVPVYNVESYVEDCLLSIKNQDFEDFEVIVVNDGSTDASLSVVERVVADDSRFKVISQVNGGLSVARNTGVRNATGEYLTFLDSDDKFSAGVLSLVAKSCSENYLDMLVYGADVFYEAGVSTIQRFDYERPSNLVNKTVTGREFFKVSINKKKYRPSACMYWLKRKLAAKYEFYPGITHEDNLYTTQILLDSDCKRLRLVDDTIYLRRVREGSIMMVKPSPKNYMGYLKVYQMLEITIVELAEDKDVKKALARFRVSLFINFTRTLVLVHGMKIPLGMRLEIWRCWGAARGCLFSPKILFLTMFPVTCVYMKKLLASVFNK